MACPPSGGGCLANGGSKSSGPAAIHSSATADIAAASAGLTAPLMRRKPLQTGAWSGWLSVVRLAWLRRQGRPGAPPGSRHAPQVEKELFSLGQQRAGRRKVGHAEGWGRHGRCHCHRRSAPAPAADGEAHRPRRVSAAHRTCVRAAGHGGAIPAARGSLAAAKLPRCDAARSGSAHQRASSPSIARPRGVQQNARSIESVDSGCSQSLCSEQLVLLLLMLLLLLLLLLLLPPTSGDDSNALPPHRPTQGLAGCS